MALPNLKKVTILAGRANASLHRVIAAHIDQLQGLIQQRPGRASAEPEHERQLLGQIIFLASDTVQTLATPTTAAPGNLSEQLFQREAAGRRVWELVQAIMGEEDRQSLADQAEQFVVDLTAALEHTEPPSTVSSLFGPSRLVDYLRANLIWMLALCHQHGLTVLPPTIAEATRSLCSVMGERFGGRTIEMRVPPLAAVQLAGFGEGSSHTRGTPPNVVETGPDTFLALALGETSWAQVRDAGLAQISGVHADEVARMLPLVQF